MDRDLPNFPILFEQLGHFLNELKALKERQATLTAGELLAEFDKLTESHGDSELDTALKAYETIVETIYFRLAGACPHGGTVIRG
jgi:hypothetical protein